MSDEFPWTADDAACNPFATMFKVQENQLLRAFLRQGGTMTEWLAAKSAAKADEAISQPGSLK